MGNKLNNLIKKIIMGVAGASTLLIGQDQNNNDNKVKEAGSNTKEVKLNKQKEIKKLVFRKNNNTQKYDLAQHSSHYSHSSHSSHSSHHSHHSHHSHYSSSGNMEFKAQDINAMGNASNYSSTGKVQDINVMKKMDNKIDLGDRILREGMRGEDVYQLQETLLNKNYHWYRDPNSEELLVDDIYDEVIENVIKAYQKDHSLTVDGSVGPKTLRSIKMMGK